MKHLTRAELLDAVEMPAHLPAAKAQHLRECASCRGEADALRDVLARAADDPMAEPSPLFWDHFASRVSDAVRTRSIASEPASWIGRLPRPLTTWALAAAATVLMIVAVVWRVTLHAPSFSRVPSPEVVARSTVALQPSAGDNVDADERWAVVRAAAEDLAWEDVRDAGISAEPGAAEGVALELTADERSELARLLNQELKRNGV